MSQLSELYQATLLTHARKPRNYGELENPSHQCHGKNPLCGDDYYLQLQLQGEHIESISFTGDGCAISKASASLMTMLVDKKSKEEALKLCQDFTSMLIQEDNETFLKKLPPHLQIFAGVREFPLRVKCATLIWRALENLLTTGQLESCTE